MHVAKKDAPPQAHACDTVYEHRKGSRGRAHSSAILPARSSAHGCAPLLVAALVAAETWMICTCAQHECAQMQLKCAGDRSTLTSRASE